MKLPNAFGELLDVVVEGNIDAETTILFVHGFGSNKNETGNYFVDVAQELGKRHRIVRFDFAGYGESEGKQENVTILRQVEDLKAVLDFVKQAAPGKIFIFAHSMGALVTSLLCPNGIDRAVFTGIPNSDLTLHKRNLERAIASRPGGILNIEGVSIYPRSTGEVQKIGPAYWTVLGTLSPLVMLMKFRLKTNLTIIHPAQDEIVGSEGMEKYQDRHINYLELPGSHNFAKPEDRANLINKVKLLFMF